MVKLRDGVDGEGNKVKVPNLKEESKKGRSKNWYRVRDGRFVSKVFFDNQELIGEVVIKSGWVGLGWWLDWFYSTLIEVPKAGALHDAD